MTDLTLPLDLLRAVLDDRYFLGLRLKKHVTLNAACVHFKFFYYDEWLPIAEKDKKRFLQIERDELQQLVKADTTESRNQKALEIIARGWAERRREQYYDFTSATGTLTKNIASEDLSSLVLSEKCCGFVNKKRLNALSFISDSNRGYINLESKRELPELKLNEGDYLKVLLYGADREKVAEKLQKILAINP